MAIACFRLVTFLPLLPLFNVPRFLSRIALLTSLEADLEYFRAMMKTSSSGKQARGDKRLRNRLLASDAGKHAEQEADSECDSD